jgi:hypothetical protein
MVVPNHEKGSQSIFTGINMRVEALTGRVKVDISCPTARIYRREFVLSRAAAAIERAALPCAPRARGTAISVQRHAAALRPRRPAVPPAYPP